MNAEETLLVFEAERQRLVGVAYRMLGSVAEAEDAVQDAWVRWQRLDPASQELIERPAAWFTTTVTRLALDRLKSAQRTREEYVGPWLPEPVLMDADPADAAELGESLTLGFLTLLERLGPVERAVFLLVDVFGEPFAAVAETVGRSEETCRQIAHRARGRLRAERRRVDVRPGGRPDLVDAFLRAAALGDIDGLKQVLADDVVLVSDGGAKQHAARRPVIGVDRVARFVVNIAKRWLEHSTSSVDLRAINGEAGAVMWFGDRPFAVVTIESDEQRISSVRIINNPDKLSSLMEPHQLR